MAQAKRIDYDRGVIFTKHSGTGVEVYMYVDEPGVYINAFEGPVDEKFAKEAGFDTEKYAKQRVYKERMRAAKNAIEAELSKITDEPIVAVEKAGFKIMDIGVGRFTVHDPQGNVLTPEPLSLEIAEKLVAALVPDKAD